MVIAGTGHRPDKLNYEYNLRGPCTQYVYDRTKEILLQERPDQVISGMALGFDTILAMVAIKLEMPVIAAIPFEGQERMWPQPSKDLYYKIITNPLVTRHYVSVAGYDPKKMQIRNCWMVDNCDKLLACFDGSSGGTGNCIRYAKKKNKDILYINPKGYLI